VDEKDTFVVSAHLGSSHLVVITRGGAAWSLGDDSKGQFGRGDKDKDKAAAAAIANAKGDAAARPAFAAAPRKEKEDSDVTAAPISGMSARVVSAAIVDQTSLFLLADGTVWACGDNSVCALGVGAPADAVRSPTKVVFPANAAAASAPSASSSS